MFALPNKAGFEVVMHFLFNCLDSARFREHFRLVFEYNYDYNCIYEVYIHRNYVFDQHYHPLFYSACSWLGTAKNNSSWAVAQPVFGWFKGNACTFEWRLAAHPPLP